MERFSYYGMRALLVIYLVSAINKGGLGWTDASASHLYGWYTGLVYLTPIVGGWLADKFFGMHRSMVLGGLIIACGHFSLAMETQTSFYLGLGLIIAGTGFFKPCVSTMVGSLYGPGDTRRDSGFTIFYMGINLGALLGALVCGYLGESPDWGWRYGFGAAGVGMVAGLLVYTLLRPKYLKGVGLAPDRKALAASKRAGTAVAHQPLTKTEKDGILAILILAVFVIFFWMAFEQAGSSMNLFALNHTNRVLGWSILNEIPASWFQSVNPAIILLAGPVFAFIWLFLGARGKEPASVVKMGFGLLLLAGGFVFMVGGALQATGGQLAAPTWLIMAYMLQTFGELCLSPVGLSMVTKLSPPRYASLLMGTWFLSNFVANLLAGYLAGYMKQVEDGPCSTSLAAKPTST